ncbi:MAG: formylglycine-generating enzyme family protein [Verrucomicrobiota bacterium]
MLAAVLVGVGALGGCSGKREVTGQVFVVTQGGENVKLGLVGIHVVKERQLGEVAARLLGQAQQAKAGEALLLELESEVKTLVSTVAGSQAGPLEKILAEASRRRAGIPRFSGDSLGRRLFGELPSAVAQTDADGMFSVEASSSDWLAARGERRTGSTTESYLWLMPLRGVSKKLLISNDRLLGDDEDLARVLASVGAGGSPSAAADPELVVWVESQRSAAKQSAVEAKAAEERALAEARAKAEAAETAMATKLGLSRPFAAGLRGQAGDLVVRWIPLGRFRMGSPADEAERFPDESLHEVELSRGFFLAETECTQGQWEAVMGGNPSNFKGVDRPVEQVSWDEAVEYCRKLTAQQRAGGVLPEGWEWRLPTEAEWEYAARAGTTGARHGELDAIAWYGDNSGRQTHPVKQKAANGWGLHDMIGNVWEWCSDWHGEYPTGSVTDPTGPNSGSDRVFRGGSWGNDARDARSASRVRNVPGDRLSFLGFRPALSSVR